MKTPHQITIEEVIVALYTPQRIMLSCSVGAGTNKRFHVVHTPTELNPYTFEVETIINGNTNKWSSTEPESMVKRYNELP